MKEILIEYQNQTYNHSVLPFESVHSICNKFCQSKNINESDIDLFYDGTIIHKDISLEGFFESNISSLQKTDIDNSSFTVLHKQKGGGNFFSFASKNIVLVIVIFIIALIPVFLLPLGFKPTVAAFIQVILDKSYKTIAKYLICDLHKFTLAKRIGFFITILKYVAFFIMIFVGITFPLILVCITMKGQSLFDDPLKMCGAINAGKISGLVLSIIYFFYYFCFRAGNIILKPLILFFKKSYITNTLFVPFLMWLLKLYDSSKYFVMFLLFPFNIFVAPYFIYLSAAVPAYQLFLNSMEELGCKMNIKSFTDKMVKGMETYMKEKTFESEDSEKSAEKKFKDDWEKYEKDAKEKQDLFDQIRRKPDKVCLEKDSGCCHPEMLKSIGDAFMSMFSNNMTSDLIKSSGFYPIYALVTQGFYESALEYYLEMNKIMTEPIDKKIQYLHDVLATKGSKIDKELKKYIDLYLYNQDQDYFDKIMDMMGGKNNFPKELEENIQEIENLMVKFASDNKTVYTPGGNTLFKQVMKVLFVDTFCNIAEHSKFMRVALSELEGVDRVVDMLKAGTSAGCFTSVCYFIVLIVLIALGIFGVY